MRERRVMLKLSGEALMSTNGKGHDEAVVRDVVRQAKRSVDTGVEVGIVIGGGNYQRGRIGTEIARVRTDQIGMLATVMNCVYVLEIFRGEGVETKIFSSFPCGVMIEFFSVDRTDMLPTAGRMLFFTGDAERPYFSTDTGIVLRAMELGIDEILLAKSIDGVYTADPKFDPDAKRYGILAMQEMIDRKLGAIDLTASVLCMENKIPPVIFDLHGDSIIADTLRGMIHGTMVTV